MPNAYPFFKGNGGVILCAPTKNCLLLRPTRWLAGVRDSFTHRASARLDCIHMDYILYKIFFQVSTRAGTKIDSRYSLGFFNDPATFPSVLLRCCVANGRVHTWSIIIQWDFSQIFTLNSNKLLVKYLSVYNEQLFYANVIQTISKRV